MNTRGFRSDGKPSCRLHPMLTRLLTTLVVLSLPVGVTVADQPSKTSGRRATIVLSSVKPKVEVNSTVVEYGLTRDDYRRIVAQVPTVQTAVPIREILREARVGERSQSITLTGTTPDFIRLHDVRIAQGRFLTQKDQTTLENVAVISRTTAQRLFPTEDPVGRSIGVGDVYFLVVGVTTVDASSTAGSAKRIKPPGNPPVYVPISTMRSRIGDTEIIRANGAFEVRRYQLSRIEICKRR